MLRLEPIMFDELGYAVSAVLCNLHKIIVPAPEQDKFNLLNNSIFYAILCCDLNQLCLTSLVMRFLRFYAICIKSSSLLRNRINLIVLITLSFMQYYAAT